MPDDSSRARADAAPAPAAVFSTAHGSHPPFWQSLKQDTFFWLLLIVCAGLTTLAPNASSNIRSWWIGTRLPPWRGC